ncbi:zinc-ribbon domain-containing protein [Intestinimonas butyriciproducens]|mgnify:CR=1 FL=1|nr:zinc-ribbon domain-containing protein [Intestinimonas butyriciproducens]
MAFCINCGQELAEGTKFCANCGTPVANMKATIAQR